MTQLRGRRYWLLPTCVSVSNVVQAMGIAMGTMVLQEQGRWLSLANLSDREKDDILDMPIVPATALPSGAVLLRGSGQNPP